MDRARVSASTAQQARRHVLVTQTMSSNKRATAFRNVEENRWRQNDLASVRSAHALARRDAPWTHDGPRNVADGFDGFIHALEADDAAWTCFKALIAPGERADDGALVQHLLDIAADIFGVNEAFLEGI
jgi:hypothetical protein